MSNININYLARALYIPAMVWALVSICLIYCGDPANGGAAAMFGAFFGVLGFCAAVKANGLINLSPEHLAALKEAKKGT
jgi:hypothetical protein